MNILRTRLLFVVAGLFGWLALAGVGHAGTLHVPRDFGSLQDAVDAANPGDTILVAQGTYSENVIVTTDGVRLLGRHATLDGMGLGGVGIHVFGASDVRIQGFTVQAFEVGIVLEGTTSSRVHLNDLLENISDIPTLRDGIQLIDAHDNEVTQNLAWGNGHNGITLKGASTGNLLRGNVSNDNGVEVAANFGGCGIQLIGAGNDNNVIAENETLRNGWGIQVGGGSNNNRVVQNDSHANDRAGVVVLDPGADNFIGQNRAQGNGFAGVAPSFAFDLFDQGGLDNTWRNNKGTFNH